MVALFAFHDDELMRGLSVGTRGSPLNGEAVLVVAVEETIVFFQAIFIKT